MSREENDLRFRWGVFDLVFLAELFSFLPAVLPACLPAVWVRLPACYPLTSANETNIQIADLLTCRPADLVI
jgi:hypothetical protein